MKLRYIIGIILAVIFIIIAVFSSSFSSIEYSNFTPAKLNSKKVQVKGTWVRDMPSNYDASTNTFSFYMKDYEEKVSKVVYKGGKPNNFEIATHIVIKGKFVGDEFSASEILTKCPSKYEGNIDDLKKQQNL